MWDDGSPVTEDDGSELTETIDTVQTHFRVQTMSAAEYERTARSIAVRQANAGHDIERAFQVADVTETSRRTIRP